MDHLEILNDEKDELTSDATTIYCYSNNSPDWPYPDGVPSCDCDTHCVSYD